MDRFSEQLIPKASTGKDMFLRGVYVAAALAVIAVLVIFFLGMGIVTIAVIAGVIWLLVWLLQGTTVEYEYIVTNDDLDVDKITGKRKRRRMITVSLKTVTELGEYESGKDLHADVTVVAQDDTGEGMYYIIAKTKKYGDLAVVFNPNAQTLYNMIGGFAPSVRNQYRELYKLVTPAEEEENPTETDTEENTDNTEISGQETAAQADNDHSEES